MRTLLLNLPAPSRVVRRYMCSYLAPNFSFPPLELLSVGGVLQEWKRADTELMDCMAGMQSLQDVEARIEQYLPAIVVSITGFECISNDLECLRQLKHRFPDTLFVLFGHYASQFPEECLRITGIDHVMLGEPELTFSALYDALAGDGRLEDVRGLCYLRDGQLVRQDSDGRIPDPNLLPMTAYGLMGEGDYFEPFMKRPFAVMQTARGCPYQCNYCVKSYGTKLTALTPENVIRDIRFLRQRFGIRSLRFIDDTFTAIPSRVKAICALLEQEPPGLEWTCLSRIDTLTEEVVMMMARCGCKRVYIGLESASPRMLRLLNKEVDLEQGRRTLRLCREAGIETAVYFISGHPDETLEDLEQSIRFATSADIDYVLLSELTPYPGTALFHTLRHRIDFSFHPYRNELHDRPFEYKTAERRFYRKFYLRPSYAVGRLTYLRNHIGEVADAFSGLASHLWRNKGKMPDFKAVGQSSAVSSERVG